MSASADTAGDSAPPPPPTRSPRSVQQLKEHTRLPSSSPQSSPGMPSLLSPLPQSATAYMNVHESFSGARSHATSQSASPIPSRGLGSPMESPRSNSDVEGPSRVWVPPSIISPAFTPVTTPGTPTLGPQQGLPVESHEVPKKLMKELPDVTCIVRARIPTTTGTEIFLHLYQNSIDNKEHLAIVFGDQIRSRSLDAPRPGESEMDRMIRGAYTGRLHPGRTNSKFDDSPASSRQSSSTSLSSLAKEQNNQARQSRAPLVRIHSECYTGEIAWSARCDCGEQLDEAARLMSLDPAGGCVVYLRQEGRGIGLGEKLKAYNLQDMGHDTVQANLMLRHPADARSYGLATAILSDLELGEIRLLTNNPDKIAAVEGPNQEVRVVERVPMIPLAWKNMKGGVTGKEVSEYLRTKITQMGHMLSMPEDT